MKGAISALSEKVLERGMEGRIHSKTGEPQSGGQGVRVTAPSSPQHCPRHPEGPSTHRHAGLEPAPLRAGPPSQDDTGQGHRLPLQHPDGGGAAGDLWGDCRERSRCQYTIYTSVQFSHSVVSDSATPWIAARQAFLSILLSHQGSL